MSEHTTQSAALPLADDDHLPLGDLAHRLRSLDADQLEALLRHEHEHGDRLPAVQPATSGPVINPPSHGDPTNPAQPR